MEWSAISLFFVRSPSRRLSFFTRIYSRCLRCIDANLFRHYDPHVRKSLLIIVFLLAAAVFEFHPAVRYERLFIAETVYAEAPCDCRCILDSRPWYSRFNYWFWLWIVAVPLLVFSPDPSASLWQRAARTCLTVILCYALMNLAIRLAWDIRNGPFTVVSSNPHFPPQKSWDFAACAYIADGASLMFTFYLGWLYAIIYTGWWEMAWAQCHKRSTGQRDKNFKRDPCTQTVVTVSKGVTLLVVFILVLSAFAVMFGYTLEKMGWLTWYRSLFIQ